MKEKEILKQLIEIKSYNENNNKEIIEYLVNKFSKFSKEILRVKCKKSDRENLIIGVNTALENVKDAIVLSGHIDTVVANEKEYLTNPYVATEKDGKLFGLGAIDMKSFFASILANIEELQKLNKPIVVVITGDEETDFDGVNSVVEALRGKVVPKLTIVGEPTNMNVSTEAKSCFDNEIIVYGKSCHSSMPQNGINSNLIAAKLILEIEKLSKKYRGTTMNANVVNGGGKVNIIPSKTSVRFDIRSPRKDVFEKVFKELDSFAKKLEKRFKGTKIEIKNLVKILPLEREKRGLQQKIIRDFNLNESEFQGGCEAGFYQTLGGSVIIFGVGDLSLAHKPNEFVVLSELEQYSKKLMEIVSKV